MSIQNQINKPAFKYEWEFKLFIYNSNYPQYLSTLSDKSTGLLQRPTIDISINRIVASTFNPSMIASSLLNRAQMMKGKLTILIVRYHTGFVFMH